MRYMRYQFLSCWVMGSFSPTFTFEKTVDSKDLIEIIRTWCPAEIRRAR